MAKAKCKCGGTWMRINCSATGDRLGVVCDSCDKTFVEIDAHQFSERDYHGILVPIESIV